MPTKGLAMKAAQAIACALACLLTVSVFGQTRVYQEGKLPNDSRLGELRHLNTHFPFAVPDSTEKWEARRDQLRMRLKVFSAYGRNQRRRRLTPRFMPRLETDSPLRRCTLKAFRVTLFQVYCFAPKQERATSCTDYGHGGRMQDHGDKIGSLIDNGDEKYENSGRQKLSPPNWHGWDV